MPSISTLVWLELVPRMNTEVTPPGPPVCTTFRPGTSLSTSAKVRSWRASISAGGDDRDAARQLQLRRRDARRGDDHRLQRLRLRGVRGERCGCHRQQGARFKGAQQRQPRRRRARGAHEDLLSWIKLRKKHTPVPEVSRFGAGEGAVPNGRTDPPASPAATPIGDTQGRSPGSRAGERTPRRIAFPRRSWRSGHVIRLISVTVAGAAPGLDESSPDFPFFRPAVRGHSLWPPHGRNRHLTRREACLRGRVRVKGRDRARARGMIQRHVETEDNRTAPAWPRANSAAEWVGYLCVAPLLAGARHGGPGGRLRHARAGAARRLPRARWCSPSSGRCTGDWRSPAACAWTPGARRRRAGAGTPGGGGILLGGQRGLALLVVGFGVFWLYEHRASAPQLPPAYLEPATQAVGRLHAARPDHDSFPTPPAWSEGSA